MTLITQGYQTGEYLLSESNGTHSRDTGTVTSAGVALPSGTVLGKVTATGKYIKQVDAASDGSQTAVAVLFTPVAAAAGDYFSTLHVRGCEVINTALNGGAGASAAAIASLKLVGILVR